MNPAPSHHIVSVEFCPKLCGTPIKRTLALSMDVDQFMLRNLFNKGIQNLVLLGAFPCCAEVYRELRPKNPGRGEYLILANADYCPSPPEEEDDGFDETF